jgi:hypothetical protein
METAGMSPKIVRRYARKIKISSSTTSYALTPTDNFRSSWMAG